MVASVLLEKSPINAAVICLFFCHIFAPTCFGRHSTMIRVLDIKEYSELQCVYSSKIQFLKCVIQL